MLVERSEADLTSVKQINTLNLRILASAETFHLPSKEKLTQLDMTATQIIYGDVQVARTDVAQTGGLVLTSKRRPGDQICSKQQLDAAFAPTANLEPNALGACMLTAAGKSNPFKARLIFYSFMTLLCTSYLVLVKSSFLLFSTLRVKR